MIKLFTHTDLDGLGCELLAKLAFGDQVDVTNSEINTINDDLKKFLDDKENYGKYSDIYITDISVNKENAFRLSKRPENVCLLDHHETALWLNQYEWAHVFVQDKKTGILTSGTELFYKNLVETGKLQETDQLTHFATTVRDYDTYRFSQMGEKGQLSKDLNDLMFLKGSTTFKNFMYKQLENGTFPYISKTDAAILKQQQKTIDTYIENKNKNIQKVEVNGYTGGAVYAEQFFSELGNELSKMHPELDFIAMIEPTKGCMSIRTKKDDVNVGKDIAAWLGGGGHQKAAGAPLSDKMKKTFKDALEESLSVGAVVRENELIRVDFTKDSQFFDTATGKLTIPDSIRRIGGNIFTDDAHMGFDIANRLKVRSVEIQGNIKMLPNGLFANCKNLTEVSLNDGLRFISPYAFLGCDSLKEISIPDSVEKIEDSAFSYCEQLSDINMSEELLEKIDFDNVFANTNLSMESIENEVEDQEEDILNK